jgi:glyoxylase-like metal-dependent hydrolase (beta-lactamase superfamily II)
MEIAPGVFTLPLEFEMDGTTHTIHPVAFERDDGVVLVDGGVPGMADSLADRLADQGLALDDVSLVLATHQDGDHVGALATVAERTGAPVVAHEADVPVITGAAEPLKQRGERPPPVPVALSLVGGETLHVDAGAVDVVHTPGHTPGHLSLHLPEQGLLIAADALIAEDGRLGGPIPEATPDEATAASSVGTLASLDVDRTLCYHGGLVEAGTAELAALRDDLVADEG